MGDAPTGAPAAPSTPVAGANTFSSLKGLFKNQYEKTCKHCGKTFVPKGVKI